MLARCAFCGGQVLAGVCLLCSREPVVAKPRRCALGEHDLAKPGPCPACQAAFWAEGPRRGPRPKGAAA